MAKRKSRKSNTNSSLSWVYIALVLMAMWLLYSIFAGKSPTQSIGDLYRSIVGKEQAYMSPSQQVAKVKYYTDSITTLQVEIERLSNLSPYRKAMVNTDNNSLNLRSEANLSSDVVLKIPDSSTVEVIYFDEEVLVLDGEPGKWCKIKYADKEGWVWGNYVTFID